MTRLLTRLVRHTARKPALVLLSGAALCGLAGQAWACADGGWEAVWGLASPAYGVGRAALSPGNDTRINLLLLMRSLRPVSDQGLAYPKPGWNDYGLGHSFMSWTGLRNTFWPQPAPADQPASASPACDQRPDAVAAFSAAAAADTELTAADRAALTALRGKVGCGAVDWNVPLSTAKAQEYLAYLQASAAFYDADWPLARSRFARLTHARSGWIAETAAYMPIRIALRQAVAGTVDTYGDFAGVDKADKPSIAAARLAIAAYLKAWPHGRYAASAQGLVRRVLWLEGNSGELAHSYERLLSATPADQEQAADLAEEIDLKLLASAQAGDTLAKAGDMPLLLAVADLAQMRITDPDKPMALSAEDLAGQRRSFAGKDDLYHFLQATRAWYAGQAPGDVLALVPAAGGTHALTPLEYSGQLLRGMALAKAHDPDEARFWSGLISRANPLYQRPLAEMGLALHWQRAGRLDMVFAPNTLITDGMTREILLQTLASPAILRGAAKDTARPAHERDVARFTLLFKDLSRGAYGDFGKDVALIPADATTDGGPGNILYGDGYRPAIFTRGKASDSFACPALTATAATLARNPADIRANLCLGEFWRLNGFDGFSLFTPDKDPETLGHGADAFPGKPKARDAIYSAIIANPKAPPQERAYALYRAVMCYAPSGYNGCSWPSGGTANWEAAQAPKDQRKAWFLELKKAYPDSEWAKKLRYFW